jgi:hypothetical protein
MRSSLHKPASNKTVAAEAGDLNGSASVASDGNVLEGGWFDPDVTTARLMRDNGWVALD